MKATRVPLFCVQKLLIRMDISQNCSIMCVLLISTFCENFISRKLTELMSFFLIFIVGRTLGHVQKLHV